MNTSGIAAELRTLALRARKRAGEAVGAGAQLVNHGWEKFGGSVEHTDMIVLQGPHTSRGAEFVRSKLGPVPPAARFDELRHSRPLLAQTSVTADDAQTTARVAFDADAPRAQYDVVGAESAMVSLYVNGRYHSDVAVLSERPSRYTVNLGQLGAGTHTIELRASTDLAGPHAPVPVRVRNVETTKPVGLEALVDRYQPVLETRWDPDGARHPATFNDIPLLMVPKVGRRPDGGLRIAYNALFSHEDGGTPIRRAFPMFGRAADFERVYHVDFDAAGRFLDDRYQGPLHIQRRFRGTHDGNRPVLRVATPNNMYTSRTLEATPRWSEATVPVRPNADDDRALMTAYPWTYAVMGRELVREGRTVLGHAPGPNQALDARHHLFLRDGDETTQVLREHDVLPVVLHDDRVVGARLTDGGRQMRPPSAMNTGLAVALPHNVRADEVRAIPGLDGEVLALDASFRPRTVPVEHGHDGRALARRMATRAS